MPVTLTDEQAQQLEREHQVYLRATKLWNDPATSEEAKALWKKGFPEEPIQGHDDKQQLRSEIQKLRDERETEKKQAQEKEQDTDLARRRADIRSKYNLDDDGLKELEDWMTKRGVADHEVAHSYRESQKPKPSEGTADYQRHFWHRERNRPEYKEVVEDPEGYAEKEIFGVVKRMQDQERERR